MTSTAAPSTMPPAAAVVPTNRTAGRREGERRKNAALELLAARRARIVTRARRALLARLLAAGTATADDVRDALGDLPPDVGPRCLGAVPVDLCRAGIVAADGYTRTTRPTAHARPVTVWRLLDAVAAQQWLDCNPELPDLDSEPLDDLPLWRVAQRKRPTAGTAGRSGDSLSKTKGSRNG